MGANDITMVYNPLNLSIEKLRKYNVEKYHFLSGILDILIFRLQVEKKYTLTQDDIYKHFALHNIKTIRLREKFNLALAQLVGSDMIDIGPFIPSLYQSLRVISSIDIHGTWISSCIVSSVSLPCESIAVIL